MQHHTTTPARARTGRGRPHAVLVGVLLAGVCVGVLPVPALPSSVAHATANDVDLQTLNVSPTSTPGTPLAPGTVFTYTIGFSCSSTVVDSCAGAVIEDVLPTFTDVFGNLAQLTSSGSPTATPGIWASGPSFTGSGTSVKVTGTLNANAQPGQMYSMSFTAVTPVGSFPVGTTQLDDVATATGGQSSPTVHSYIAATTPSWYADKTGPSTLLLGASGTYNVRACPTTAAAALPASFTLSDALPQGATFVSATNGGQYTGDTPADGTGDVVAWTFDSNNRPWPSSGNCVQASVVVRFVEDPAYNNLTNVDKVDTLTGTFDASSLGSDTVTTGLRGPITSVNGSKSVGVGGYYVKNGDAVEWNLGFQNTSEIGAANLDTLVAVDDLSSLPDVDLVSIAVGSWTSGPTAVVETSPDGSVWTALPGGPFTGTNATISAPVGTRRVRWTFTGPLPVGFSTSGVKLIGVVSGSGSPARLNTNCLDVTATRGATTFSDLHSCANVYAELPTPHPRIDKSVTSVVAADATAHTASTVVPGDTIHYAIALTNDADATGNLVDPVITDCAAVTDYLLAPVVTVVDPAHWAQVAPDLGEADACTALGGTFLKFVYTAPPVIAPGQTVTVATYTVATTAYTGGAPGPTPAGNYDNTATVTKATGTFDHGTYTDTARVTVPAFIYLSSKKWVLGAKDEADNSSAGTGPGPNGSIVAGETAPGGSLRWYLTVQNRGNVAAVDPVYVDIFPYVGDTGVKVIGQTRASEWAPYLVAPIVPSDPDWTVEYSTSTNPCRPEVGPTPSSATPWPSGCQTANWSTDTSLFALPTYRSIRISYDGTIAVGAPELTFAWEMRAPVYDTSYDTPHASSTNPYERLAGCNADPDLVTQDPSTTSPCPRAINSFAWSAEATGIPAELNPGRLSAEPPRAGIQVMAPPTVGNAIGDRVWYDTDYDGIQDATETGVAGVYVELWREDPVPANGYALYGYTYTDANGNYLFGLDKDDADLGLPDGNYQVRFFPPSGWYVSPSDADALGGTDLGTPANGDTDSDVSRTATGTVGANAYHQTPVVALAGNEHDLTWDMGLWRPEPAIQVVKVTKDTAWADGSAGDGVTVFQGRPVTWIYTVTNTGNTRLQNVTLSDNGGPDPTFSVTNCTVQTDGTNADGLHSSATAPMSLNRGGVLRCTATGTAGSSTYSNIATTSGVPKRDDGSTAAGAPSSVTDTDPSSYQVAKYDLALIKTVASVDYAAGNVTYTITVKNQGTVASGVYDVTDTLPTGTSFVSASPSASTTSATTVVWSARPTVAANTTASAITLTVHIDDYHAGPFRNFAEVSDDSSELVTTAGVSTPTVDVDSTPDATTGNDMPNPKTYGTIGSAPSGADNTTMSQAGVGNDGEDDADIADVVAAPTYDLALIKTVNATGLSGIGNGNVVWTITVANQGTVPSGTYEVTDTVPAGMVVTTPVPGSGTVHTGSVTTITWNGTNLAPGATATFTFTTTISDVTQRDFRNVAEISHDSAQTLYGVNDVDSTPDADPGNDMPYPKTYGTIGSAPSGADNTLMSQAGVGNDGQDDADIADVTLPLTGGYDLALAKTVDEAVVTWDDTITYTITVQNQGVLDSREVVVTDHVPAGLTLTDLGGATDHHDGTISWTIDNIVAGGSVTLTFDATISDITQRPFRNVAEISHDSADDYSSADELITDADSTPDAIVDNDGDYGGIGDGDAIDNVDTGTDPVTPAIAAAGVGADAPASGGEDDADIADVTVVEVSYDLALVKTGPAVMDPTGTVTFTIVVANQGNVPSGAYSVTDAVPVGLTATAANQGGSLASPSTEVVWTDLPSLLPGATTTLTVTMRISDITKRPFLNVAEITDDSADTYTAPEVDEVTDLDSVPGDEASSDSDSLVLADAGAGDDAGYDDEDVASVTTDPVYDLALVKVADRSTTTYDGSVIWTVTIVNQGNVPSGTFTVTDTIPVGMAYDAASDGGAVAGDGRTVTWVLPSLLPGGTRSVTLTTHVTDVTKRPFRNSAEITADGSAAYTVSGGATVHDTDSVPGDASTSSVDITAIDQAGVGADAGYDDEDVAVVDVHVVYDLDLVKRLPDGQSLKLGSVLHYQITVSNQGNVPSGPYTVVDDLPLGLTFVGASNGATAIGQRVTWTDLPSILPGASAVVTVDARLDDLTQTSYVNVASIAKDGAVLVSTPDDPVVDVDSHPALPNDAAPAIEDDEGSAALSMSQVATDNSTPTNLPRTGGDPQLVLRWALLAVVAGTTLVVATWRRRRRSAPVT